MRDVERVKNGDFLPRIKCSPSPSPSVHPRFNFLQLQFKWWNWTSSICLISIWEERKCKSIISSENYKTLFKLYSYELNWIIISQSNFIFLLWFRGNCTICMLCIDFNSEKFEYLVEIWQWLSLVCWLEWSVRHSHGVAQSKTKYKRGYRVKWLINASRCHLEIVK